MLKQLNIQNYALIKDLAISPDARLNIITGETGAGKSIMLGAVGLLLGKRADTKVLLDEGTKCVVEGTFDIKSYTLQRWFEEQELDYFDECIIRREISPNGKSRGFINDTPTTLDVMRDLGNTLMDVHSQHETLLLGEGDFQLNLVDAFAKNEKALNTYQEHFRTWQKVQREHKKLLQETDQQEKEADYNKFLYEELEKADLKPDEQAQLEEELETLENAEEIKLRLNETLAVLDREEFSALPLLHQAVGNFQKLSAYSTAFSKLFERLESAEIELRDALREIESQEESTEHDPVKIEATKERLSLIYQLQQKHHVETVAELLEIQDTLASQLEGLENRDEKLKVLEKQEKELREKVQQSGKVVSDTRQKVFGTIEKEVRSLLTDLGMPDAQFQISHKIVAPQASGQDEIQFLFTANKGITPQALDKVASGGEFSRLMLAFKYLVADKMSLPTIVFDEIDTGISGEIALKMANMMKKMAESHQVIAISHLPQIAARGNAHYYVFKDNSAAKTISKIRLLEQKERTLEIAKMIGGDTPSMSAMESAQELLKA